MSSIMPGGPVVPRFVDRLRRREPMVGAIISAARFSADLVTGFDVVVLRGPLPLEVLARVREPVVEAALLVETDDEIAGATSVGLAAVGASETVHGADAVLSERGPVRVVRSVPAARTAFASGASLVLYDLDTMIGELVGSLARTRPGPIGLPTTPLSDRQPLVMLSGMLGDASLWDEVAAELADVALPRALRIDRGESVPELARSVLAEAPARFALAGHSLGAIVALEVVRQAPARVTRLALINASGRGPSPGQLDTWRSWNDRTESGELPQIVADLARATLAPAHRDDPVLVDRNARMATTVGRNGFLRQLAAQATRPDSLDRLGEIAVPVLVVTGELDEICPPALQIELADHCPTARRVTIAATGHMVPLEAPAELAAQLRSWLAQ